MYPQIYTTERSLLDKIDSFIYLHLLLESYIATLYQNFQTEVKTLYGGIYVS